MLDVPKFTNRRLRWVRVEVHNGVVTCKDVHIRREVERLKPIGGPPPRLTQNRTGRWDGCASTAERAYRRTNTAGNGRAGTTGGVYRRADGSGHRDKTQRFGASPVDTGGFWAYPCGHLTQGPASHKDGPVMVKLLPNGNPLVPVRAEAPDGGLRFPASRGESPRPQSILTLNALTHRTPGG